jgi:hypothetical protein
MVSSLADRDAMASLSNTKGILHFSLVERIPATDLRMMIEALDNLYFGFLWLDMAQEGYAPDPYQPGEEEILYINRVEIGTPNMLEVIGKMRPLAATAKFIAQALGKLGSLTDGVAERWVGDEAPGVQVVEVNNISREAEDQKQEVAKLLETAHDLYETAETLYQDGKINEEQLAHKAQMQEDALRIIHEVMRKNVRDVKLTLAPAH